MILPNLAWEVVLSPTTKSAIKESLKRRCIGRDSTSRVESHHWKQNSIMNLSFGSFTCLSPHIHELNFQWNSSHNRSNFSLGLLTNTTTNTSSRLIARVLEQGLEVVSPDTDASLRSRPVVDTKEEAGGALNGLAGTEQEAKTVKSPNRLTKKRDDEESSNIRFKLRNGKEVNHLFIYCCFFVLLSSWLLGDN